MNLKYEINKEYIDEFGRVSGIFAVDKPAGITSHDLVDQYRKKYNTRKVGHAGALDPFATGLMIILVGKGVKLSDDFLGSDKEYEAEVLLGKATDSGDPEGTVIAENHTPLKITEADLKKAFEKFIPEYKQYVPVFSSVKVKGEKLRKLAREYEKFELKDIEENGEIKRVVQFYKNDEVKKSVDLPRKLVRIFEIELKEFTVNGTSAIAKIRVHCSKGTYIRQLAVDIGEALGVPSMLINLRRTKIADITL